jgi:hypothetical protein
MRLRGRLSSLVVSLALAGSVGAADRYELSYLGINDDTNTTANMLRHGTIQADHDLEGSGASLDNDWMRVRVKAGHSYEARVSSDVVYWDAGCGSPPCPRFDRVDSSGAVLTAGVATSDDIVDGIVSYGLSARWISTVDGPEFLRARGDGLQALPAGSSYRVEFLDTTYFVPRWNNTASQTTVFIIQNTTNATVVGFIFLYNAAGTILHSQSFSIVPSGVVVFSTSGVAALAGQSGSARVAHSGTYGALAGKAVALEPATGFTFDTPMTPLPR